MRKKNISLYIAGIIIAIVILAPIYWMIISAISPKVELLTKPPHWFPHNPSAANFLKLIKGGEGTSGEIPNFSKAMINSFGIAILTGAIAIVLALFAAYSLSRLLGRKVKNIYLNSIIIFRMFPEISLVLALYLIITKMGLIDTWLALIIVYLSFVLPYSIWMLYGFFLKIPRELEEAAKIDGASTMKIFLKIDLPLLIPQISTTFIFIFLMCWDEFLYALILTHSMRAKTITVAVSEFTTRHMIDYGLMMAGGLLASIPPLIIATIFQKYIVQGLTAGAVKG